MSYEAHFGFSGAPFRLSPDPSIFFEGRLHKDALHQLSRGLREGRSVVVLSGEIGTGKTLLARALFEVLGAEGFALARLVSTQLDGPDLLRAIVGAFDASRAGRPQVELHANLHALLIARAREGLNPLLLIDEAQNLSDEGLAVLGALVGARTETHEPLQLCLVGQPELLVRLNSERFTELRDRIGASCRLGALNRLETRAYIEHRLRAVGWASRPDFGVDAFEEIFRWTAGVPRRVNHLCERLLTILWLEGRFKIDLATVTSTAEVLRAEVGGPLPPSPAGPRSAANPACRVLPPAAYSGRGPLLCVASSECEFVRAAPLLRAFANSSDLPEAVLVRACADDALSPSLALFDAQRAGSRDERLEMVGGSTAAQAAHAAMRFELLVDGREPAAVVTLGSGHVSFECALIAHRRGVPLVHLDGGARSVDRLPADDALRVQMVRLADLIYASEPDSLGEFRREGTVSAKTVCVGSILADAVELARGLPSAWSGTPAVNNVGTPTRMSSHDYGLVVLDRQANLEEPRLLGKLIAVLRQVSRDIALVWPMHTRVRRCLSESGLDPWIASEQISCLPGQGFVEVVAMLSKASCLLTDSWDMQEAATVLGVPCLTLGADGAHATTVTVGSNTYLGCDATRATRAVWEILFNGGKRGRRPELWDGQAAERVAKHLGSWLVRRSRRRPV